MSYMENELGIVNTGKVDNELVGKLVEQYRIDKDEDTKIEIFKLEYYPMYFIAKRESDMDSDDLDSTMYFAFDYLLNNYRGNGKYFGNYIRMNFPTKFKHYMRIGNINSTPLYNCKGANNKYMKFGSLDKMELEISDTPDTIVEIEYEEIINGLLPRLMAKIESMVSLLEAKCVYKQLDLRSHNWKIIETSLPKIKTEKKWEIDKEKVLEIAQGAFAKLRKDVELIQMFADYQEYLKKIENSQTFLG